MSTMRRKPCISPPLPERLREMAHLHSSQIKNSFFVLLAVIDLLELEGGGKIRRSENLLNSVKDLDLLLDEIERRTVQPETLHIDKPAEYTPLKQA
jgi:hypothetical protein